MNSVPLLILAGGRAERLGSLSAERPKFLMSLGPGETFADIQLAWVAKQGFRDVVLSVGWLGDMIKDYCGNGSRWNLNIRYCFDGPRPLGTAGALRAAFPVKAPAFTALIYGDTILDLPCAELVETAQQKQMSLMSVFENFVPGHICNADFDGTLVRYSKKHPQPGWKYIDYGFLVLRSEVIEAITPGVALDLAVPLEKLSLEGNLAGYLAKRRFWEIGTPQALAEFKAHFGLAAK